ncbi:hypothetical protein [Nocardia sp. NPDC049149]|uniref:hypothetical protein n=1 Tax=Nocardia sp. NPDC049149 TaxID=3364315 RepID=UPI00371B3D9F
MSLRRRNVLAAALAALAVTACGTTQAPDASAASNAVPSYEIKLNLGATALDSTGALTPEVRSTFGLGGTPKELAYEYFDTAGLDLNAAGWSVRLRHKAGSDFDLNYKKRFPVADGALDAALTQANKQGFDSSDTDYEAQVDWTYSKMTLSFATKKSESAKGYQGTALPSESDARALLVARLPGKLKDWSAANWGKDTLKASRQHGPVQAKDWTGTWQGTDIDIEVVPIRAASGSGTETVIELSFKADKKNDATTLRDKAIDTLRTHGWLASTDVLKTDLILQRY